MLVFVWSGVFVTTSAGSHGESGVIAARFNVCPRANVPLCTRRLFGSVWNHKTFEVVACGVCHLLPFVIDVV